MENVQISSVEQATLVVGVLAMATEDENGISGDSQVIKIEDIKNWGYYLTMLVNFFEPLDNRSISHLSVSSLKINNPSNSGD